jgi:5-methyltetrahydrofolate--homocysteine methyltransferase
VSSGADLRLAERDVHAAADIQELGPDMFDEFVKPELVATCRRMKNAFYHLDGVGQLPHLDSLLAIPELKGIQWIPGDGQPDIGHWPEIYRKIRRAGKLIQIFGGQSPLNLDVLEVLADQLGSANGICMIGNIDATDEDKARRVLEKFGVE